MKLIPVLACAALLTIPLQAQQGSGEKKPPQGESQERGGRERGGQERQGRRRRGGGFGVSAEALDTLLKKYDKNKDGKIERDEYPRSDAGFANLDKDGNGVIEKADLQAPRQRGGRRGGRGVGRGAGRGAGGARPAAAKIPEVGEVAPDFDLPLVEQADKDNEQSVKLSSFRGKKPVALIFGSYT